MPSTQIDHREAVLAQLAAERHRKETLISIVRAVLGEQPSPNTVRSAARRLNVLVLHISEEIAEGFEASDSTS
ncbi:hypothetical protein AB0D14_02025 [Streptomyces sp. NPDC048484]|uniref:hypothetical protein n=1 Tax=Streptomyces sp. NPDC048484 TaxID=3155146 RepID=UPI003429B8CA